MHTRLAIVFVAGVWLAAAPGWVFAGQAPAPVQGELLQVSTEAMTLTVRPAAGQPLQFRFTSKTEVAGARDSIAGLATARNVRVTVHYTQDGDTRIATRIEVHAQADR